VMATYGLCNALGSKALGSTSDRVGRAPVLAGIALFELGAFAVLAFLTEGRYWPFFLAVALLGSAEGAMHTQLYALFGTVFDDSVSTAAMAALQVIRALSAALAFGVSEWVSFRGFLTVVVCLGITAVVSAVFFHWTIASLTASTAATAIIDAKALKNRGDGENGTAVLLSAEDRGGGDSHQPASPATITIHDSQ
jgi:MFS family permease